MNDVKSIVWIRLHYIKSAFLRLFQVIAFQSEETACLDLTFYASAEEAFMTYKTGIQIFMIEIASLFMIQGYFLTHS